MGHLVYYSFHHVRIPKTQVAAALTAIHTLYQPEMIEQFGTAMTYDPTTNTTKKGYRGGHLPPMEGFTTLIEALRAWSLGAVQEPDGSVAIIEYRADKAGDESLLFAVISPFVDTSCNPRIDVFQDNHEHWRHCFSDGQYREVPGRVVYADEYPELFNQTGLL